MATQSCDWQLGNEAVDTMKKQLIPRVDILTPSLPGALVMLGREIPAFEELE